jgi:hypothetical protein
MSVAKNLSWWTLPYVMIVKCCKCHLSYITCGQRCVLTLSLIEDLGLDWRMGAEWFESYLLDHDVCSNYGRIYSCFFYKKKTLFFLYTKVPQCRVSDSLSADTAISLFFILIDLCSNFLFFWFRKLELFSRNRKRPQRESKIQHDQTGKKEMLHWSKVNKAIRTVTLF